MGFGVRGRFSVLVAGLIVFLLGLKAAGDPHCAIFSLSKNLVTCMQHIEMMKAITAQFTTGKTDE